mmetsp:Transcript_1552/g.4531  ORF Transcript_1552/g.4531 Transcript_1552/m.4531 type:complete len:223 (+) Transcript_1552:1370-2038(+)
MSTTYTSMGALSTCRRKAWPNPLPSAAPSTRPGMSATLISEPSSKRTVPRLGQMVVKAYGSASGVAAPAVSARSSDDLPAFGRPTSPMSATVLSSSRSSATSPASPGSASVGERCWCVKKLGLPRPPAPPRATTSRSPSRDRSASTPAMVPRAASQSYTSVPRGTRATADLPPAPASRWPPPAPPRSAVSACLTPARSVLAAHAWSTTSPPLPPLPPSGGPL